MHKIVFLSSYLFPGLTAYFGLSLATFTCPTLFNFYPDANDCTKFYRCSWGKGYLFNCPAGTRWSQTLLTCDHSYNVPCDKKPVVKVTYDPHYGVVKEPVPEAQVPDFSVDYDSDNKYGHDDKVHTGHYATGNYDYGNGHYKQPEHKPVYWGKQEYYPSQSQYPSTPSYHQVQYPSKPVYRPTPVYHHEQPEYQQPEYQQPEYHQPEYHQPEYHQPEYHQPEYHQPEYHQPEYQQPEYHQPEYQQPEYQQPEYHQPEYQQPEYQQPEYQHYGSSEKYYKGEAKAEQDRYYYYNSGEKVQHRPYNNYDSQKRYEEPVSGVQVTTVYKPVYRPANSYYQYLKPSHVPNTEETKEGSYQRWGH
ncbi:early nodulin-75 [Aplysia californica]|uniref:Early nodulin-75 n=1 Tax=Aplysia californica TaxID=6500 RepID=A0ABM0ZWU9_APLCA|nr:early nodulin-75 [Aplysia californica]